MERDCLDNRILLKICRVLTNGKRFFSIRKYPEITFSESCLFVWKKLEQTQFEISFARFRKRYAQTHHLILSTILNRSSGYLNSIKRLYEGPE